MGSTTSLVRKSHVQFQAGFRRLQHLLPTRLPYLGSAEKLSHCESRCHTDLKMMASEEICSDSTPDFPPKCRHFGTLNTIILHLFGLKRVETLTLRGFILIQQALLMAGYCGKGVMGKERQVRKNQHPNSSHQI
jgi:hypothetical protein